MMELNAEFWSDLYQSNDTGWDLGKVSPPLKSYFDRLSDKSIRILIPGAGNAHEARYLFDNGFSQVHVLDWAAEPLENLGKAMPEIPQEQLIQDDFFAHRGEYDLIIEQTFFCALDPALRERYVKQGHQLLSSGGTLAGLLFKVEMRIDHPPYGGTEKEYQELFSSQFETLQWHEAQNSVESRHGKELFFELRKR